MTLSRPKFVDDACVGSRLWTSEKRAMIQNTANVSNGKVNFIKIGKQTFRITFCSIITDFVRITRLSSFISSKGDDPKLVGLVYVLILF